ncbi:MAG TPA: polysaccharide deacetylase family protein [Terriglobales bacterium]|nr:polysaccharide deacetylase family protein [Terriglobales bacterium]
MPSTSQFVGRWAARLPGGRGALHRAAGLAAPGVAPIFMLHRVLPEGDPCYEAEMAISLAAFEAFLDWLERHYTVVPLGDLLPRLRRPARERPRPLCALTFDDGWHDNYRHAFPVLRRRGLPATIFLPVRFMGSERRFWQERLFYHLRGLRERSDALPTLQQVAATLPWCPRLEAQDLGFAQLRQRLMRRASSEAEAFVARLGEHAAAAPELAGRAFMGWDEVRSMQAAGIEFGSHTLDHTLLSCEAPAAAAAELQASRRELGERLGTEVAGFSFPWGGRSPFSRRQVEQAGYHWAVTTAAGFATARSDALLLPRVPISNGCVGARVAAPQPPPGGQRPAPVFQAEALAVHLARRRRGERSQPQSRERMRIGFLVESAAAREEGRGDAAAGAATLVPPPQVRDLMEALDPQYFEPELYFARSPAGGLPRPPRWPCFVAAGGGTPRLATLAALWRLLRQRQPAVLYTALGQGRGLGQAAAWLAGVPATAGMEREAVWAGKVQAHFTRVAGGAV